MKNIEPVAADVDVENEIGERGYSPFRTYLAWAVIALVVTVIVAMTQIANRVGQISPQMTSATSVYLGKYIIGSAEFAPETKEQVRGSVDTDTGPVRLRLQNIVVLADVSDAEAARKKLEALQEKMDAEAALARTEDRDSLVTDLDQDLHRILSELYAEGTEPKDAVANLSEEDKQKLTDELGWFGELALVPAGVDDDARDKVVGPAVSVAMGSIVGALLFIGFAGMGFVGVVLLVVFVATGKIGSRLPEGLAHRQLYLETFAIWLVGLTLAQVVVPFVAASLPDDYQMPLTFAMFMGSLIALIWPKLHGVTFGEIARDIGWSMPKPGWATPFYGISGYLMAIPVLVTGLLITIGLTILTTSFSNTNEFAVPQGPAHPIVNDLMNGEPWQLFMAFLLASVAAPIVEETMFRGVLYRYLRDATRARRIWMSIAIATVVNCFVFAAIHPQGLVAIPVLMSLAVAFTMARELLDSIVPAMLMHGISNGVTLSVALFVFGG